MRMMDVIPTGSIKLDMALGTGGIPRGEITEIFGSPSAGKSTLALQIVAQAQKRGLRCLYMDMENGLNPRYAVCCGVDEQRMLLARPLTGEDALEMCCLLFHTKDIDLVIIDSLAALVSEKEIQVRERAWGQLNRLLSFYLRKIERICHQTQGTLVCTNQMRTRIRPGYGTPETTPGGMTVKLHAAVRIELRIQDHIRHQGNNTGVKIQAEINKNRFSAPKKRTVIEIVYNRGVIRERELLSLGLNEKIITRQGSNYWYRNHHLGQGQRAVEGFLHHQTEIAQKLERAIRLSINPKTKEPLS